jgi:putative DNA methylase
VADGVYRKKLIEVALPLDAINAESAREKSIRHGHPSTLHLWWARRPLAACRAVLFAQLVDDPSAHPEQFPTEEAQDVERQRLFAIIEDLVKWENSTNESVLEAARAEIRRSCDGNPPPILDPFAGGGSIPLEAQRLGLEAHASDLNPVAVLINKALIEIPPRWADRPPVHPEAENRTRWHGAEGLAEDVRRYGKWMRDEAERRIGHLYPKATLPDGSKANVIAWIWARTVTCPNPACGATMPLVRSLWLSKKKGNEAWVKPVVEGKGVRFEIAHTREGPEPEGTVGRTGAVCLICKTSVQLHHVRSEGRAGRMANCLLAVVADGDRRRVYLPATEEHIRAAVTPKPVGAPVSALPQQALGFRIQAYGMSHHSDLFVNRQLTALTAFSNLVSEADAKIQADAANRRYAREEARSYALSITTYLGLLSSRVADQLNSLTRWSVSRDQSIGLFARHAIPMVWDYPEVNPFAGAAGDLEVAIESGAKALLHLRPSSKGTSVQSDARDVTFRAAIATDPPYYDNIGYADLSDFFYVWLRLSLGSMYPELFGTMVTPKEAELIASPYRHGGSRQKAQDYFENGFIDVFERFQKIHAPGVPLLVFYAFKQSENPGDGIMASTGWSTMLEGLAAAGWMVTATWPLRTERAARSIAIGTNSLASSVVLACRPRPIAAGVTDRQGLIRALQAELSGPLRELQKANIAPVDLRQAAIGPGMAVFSRFAKVVELDASPMRVRTALGLINQVLDQVLDEQQEDLDAETRWAVQWFSQFYGDEGPYGVAEQLAVSMNIAVRGLVESGILCSGGGRVRLLAREELRDDWDPLTDPRTSAWEATQHLVKRLEGDGEAGAGRLLNQLEHKGGGLAESAQLLAYRLYTLCEQARPAEAGPYNALVASWPEIQRLARETGAPTVVAEQQSWET